MISETPWYVRLGLGVAASIGAHVLVLQLIELLPEEDAAAANARVTIAIVQPPEPPKPPAVEDPPPEPPKPADPVPEVKPLPPPPNPLPQQAHPPPPRDTPPPTKPPVDDSPPNPNAKSTDTGDTPVFGATMESTSQGGNGPAIKVGNTLSRGGGGPAAPDAKAPPPGTGSGAPVAAYEVTKMPLPQGRCAGKYTDDAKTAGIEGVVVLDLVVDANGRAQDIAVVQGLDHGLTEAAVAALKACTFTPGERAGVKVPVKVRGFKIRFVMDQP